MACTVFPGSCWESGSAQVKKQFEYFSHALSRTWSWSTSLLTRTRLQSFSVLAIRRSAGFWGFSEDFVDCLDCDFDLDKVDTRDRDVSVDELVLNFSSLPSSLSLLFSSFSVSPSSWDLFMEDGIIFAIFSDDKIELIILYDNWVAGPEEAPSRLLASDPLIFIAADTLSSSFKDAHTLLSFSLQVLCQ